MHMEFRPTLLPVYKIWAIYLSCFLPTIANLTAQTVIPVETSNLAMVLEAGKNKDLNIIYFGNRLNDPAEYVRIPGQVIDFACRKRPSMLSFSSLQTYSEPLYI